MEEFIKIETLQQFDEATKQKSIFLFTADWCPDCVYIQSFIKEIVIDNPEFIYYVVDRDQHIEICKDLDIFRYSIFCCF